MSDLVERLRAQGKDAFAKHYSLGMFKLCDEAADRIEALEEALHKIDDITIDHTAMGIARKALAHAALASEPNK